MSEEYEARKIKKAKFVDTATGDIWVCPICGQEYRLIHRDPVGRGRKFGHCIEEIKR